MIGAIVMTHGDDKGLVLPPRLAPYQVVIVPINPRGNAPGVDAEANEIAGRLRAARIRTYVDDRDHLTPGFKYNEWEMRGVPIRIEIGPRDIEAGHVMLVRRIGDEGKQAVPIDSIASEMPRILDEFQEALLARAKRFRDDHTCKVDTWADFADAVSTGWALAMHCGGAECEAAIKTDTAATPRCIPAGGARESGPCVRCGSASAYGRRVIFARAY